MWKKKYTGEGISNGIAFLPYVFFFHSRCHSTLFSKRNAHWFHAVFPLTPGHWHLAPPPLRISNGIALTRGRLSLDESGGALFYNFIFTCIMHYHVHMIMVSIIMVCDSVCPSVRPSITTAPAAANGPMDMIFGMRGVRLHIYYIQFGQYTHPMGSGRPPWAAGES